MAIPIYPPNGAIIDTYTDIQREFLDNIKANGITEALDRLLPHKNGAELSLPAPIRFAWSGVADTFVFEISEAQDFFHSHTAKTTEPHLTLTNLKVGQKYYWRINGGEVFCFETKPNRYRFIEVEGALNVRDLGGINVKQGLVFRGSEFNAEYKATDNGKETLAKCLRIKTVLNLRKETKLSDGSICLENGAVLKCLPYRPYCEIFYEEHRRAILDIMQLFADEENYPIYFHCLGGADRTGMIALFLRALLWESDEDILTDYELTSLSSYAFGRAEGARALGYRSRETDYFKEFMSALSAHGGNSLSERVEAFLLECGLLEQTIEKIRSILKK